MVYENRDSSDIEQKALKAIGETFDISVVESSILVTFPYEYPKNIIEMEHSTDEFSCLCPFSGLPDFARISLIYVPGKLCIELKSFKYYLLAFRQVKIFHEHVVNKIMEDLVKILNPVELKIEAIFNLRGGIETKASACYKNKDLKD
ncbi:MAG: preQ(1) synthase [Candidatus Kaelpia aquatica]|nr:preQ(1) synthase [Candidatus Kaelpia aquatica]